LEQISKYLDTAGNKLDYRRYGEVLFDILIAGGLLVPGGSISQDGEKPYTKACIFAASEDMESMREQEQVSNNFRTCCLGTSLELVEGSNSPLIGVGMCARVICQSIA